MERIRKEIRQKGNINKKKRFENIQIFNFEFKFYSNFKIENWTESYFFIIIMAMNLCFEYERKKKNKQTNKKKKEDKEFLKENNIIQILIKERKKNFSIKY